MSVTEVKADILRKVEGIEDPTTLEDINTWIEDYTNNKIIGYRIDGTPITAEEFAKQSDEASERIRNGHYYTIEQLRNRVRK